MKRMSAGDRAVNFVFYLFLIILCILCAYPVWYTLVASISGPTYVNSGAFILIPRDIQFAAYKYAFNQPQLWRGYGNTIMYTVCGTMLALFICLPAGYSLSRKDLPFRGNIGEVQAPGGHRRMGTAVHPGHHHTSPEAFRLAGVAENLGKKAHSYKF